MLFRSIIATVISLFLFSLCFGQANEITSQEYLDAYVSALSNVSGLARRRVQKTEEFVNGRLAKTFGEIEEVQDHNTRRIVYTETIGKRQTREEIIETDGRYYCRTGLGRWKTSEGSCLQRGARLVEGDSESQEHFSTEQVTLGSIQVTLLRSYLTFKTPGVPHIWENRVWIDRNNRIVRREFKSGILNKKYTSLVETYDYSVKLKILAPLKRSSCKIEVGPGIRLSPRSGRQICRSMVPTVGTTPTKTVSQAETRV